MKNTKSKITQTIIYIFLSLLVLVYLLPLFWIVMNTIKENQEFQTAPFAKPQALNMEDFKEAGEHVDFSKDFEKKLEKKVASAKKEGVAEADAYKELFTEAIAANPDKSYVYYEMLKAAANSSLDDSKKAELYEEVFSTLTVNLEGSQQKRPFYRDLIRVISKGTIKKAEKTVVLTALEDSLSSDLYRGLRKTIEDSKELAEAGTKKSSLRKEAWNFTRLANRIEENIKGAWVDAQLGTALKNSAIVCFSTLVLSLLVGSMAAFAIGRMRWKLSGAAMTYFLLGMMVPVHCVLISLYTQFAKIGLRNSLISIIIPYATFALPITIYIMVGFFKSMPGELFEAACIDGCSIYRCFFTIALPLAKTGLFVTGLMTFVGNWNELLLAMVFISDKDIRTIPIALTSFAGPHQSDIVKSFAAIVVALLPNIVVYCTFSNQIVEGLTVGAVKG